MAFVPLFTRIRKERGSRGLLIAAYRWVDTFYLPLSIDSSLPYGSIEGGPLLLVKTGHLPRSHGKDRPSVAYIGTLVSSRKSLLGWLRDLGRDWVVRTIPLLEPSWYGFS
nr:MAG: hypothetical protein H1RhizoLitter12217_000002 [Mitovirus sp.]